MRRVILIVQSLALTQINKGDGRQGAQVILHGLPEQACCRVSRNLQRHLCHITAAPRAILAGTSAALHLRVRCKGLAVASTSLAEAGAGVADHRMLRRVSQQGVGGRLAHLGAVQQECQVSRRYVPPSLLRTIPSCVEAHRMRFHAAVDTILDGHRSAGHARHRIRLLGLGNANTHSKCSKCSDGQPRAHHPTSALHPSLTAHRHGRTRPDLPRSCS